MYYSQVSSWALVAKTNASTCFQCNCQKGFLNTNQTYIPKKHASCNKSVDILDQLLATRQYHDAGADQFSFDRRGTDFPRGVHCCATKELTEHFSSSTTVVGYVLVVSHTKLLLTVLHLPF